MRCIRCPSRSACPTVLSMASVWAGPLALASQCHQFASVINTGRASSARCCDGHMHRGYVLHNCEYGSIATYRCGAHPTRLHPVLALALITPSTRPSPKFSPYVLALYLAFPALAGSCAESLRCRDRGHAPPSMDFDSRRIVWRRPAGSPVLAHGHSLK